MTDNKVYLVDGSGYIFRAFFATPPLTNSEGMPTNALFAFTRMMSRLLSDYSPEKIAVIFDTSSKNFRHEMYSEYKANRSECPEDLVPQMPFFREIVSVLGIKSLEQVGFEADDLIATLAKQAVDGGHEVEVLSGDKDLLQLVGENLRVRDAMKNKLYDSAGVVEKFGVPPELMTDYLALVGDSSDNVPGISGVGPKSAVKLITELGGVEEIISRKDEIAGIKGLRGAKSIGEKVENGIEELRLSHELVKLRYDVKLEVTVDDLEPAEISFTDAEELFSKLGFADTQKLLGKLSSKKSSNVSVETVEKKYSLVTSENLDEVIREIEASDRIGFDTETTSLDVREAKLVGFSLAPKPYSSFYVPIGETFSVEDIKEKFSFLFSGSSKVLCGFNLKYDLHIFENAGIEVLAPLSDAMIAAYLLHPDKKRGGLKKMTEVYFDETMTTFDQLMEGKSCITELRPEEIAPYACHDADASLRLCNRLEEQLRGVSSKLFELYQNIEMPTLPVLVEMEGVGIQVDLDGLETLRAEFDIELKDLESRVHSLADSEFNLNSPKQVSEVLFGNMGLPTAGLKKTTHGFSTDVNVLTKLAPEHEIARDLLEYREVSKLQNTYVKGLQKITSPDKPRVHTTYNQAVAATGRLSSSDPNLQNLPIKGERGKRVRGVFVAKEGFTLLSLDYSQVELRILAHLSQDEALIEAFRSGQDIHEETARNVFASKYEEGLTSNEAKDLRRVAKTINFGVIYGVSAFRLARDLEIPRTTAKGFIDGYFERYSSVKAYFEECSRNVEQDGFAETLYGRRRTLADIDASGRDSGYGRRSLMNFPIQGTAADIVKLAMLKVRKELKELFDSGQLAMLMQVHDELVFEVDRQISGDVGSKLGDLMKSSAQLDVPLLVDCEEGERWSVVDVL